MRVGSGLDIHRLVEGEKLILAGLEIPAEKGAVGHSDADVLSHAVIDALLGAVGAGDIGEHFPPDEEEYRDISSLKLLERAAEILACKGFKVINIDITLVLKSPRINQHKETMKSNLAGKLSINKNRINIKATTSEDLGFVGRKAGIIAQAQVLVEQLEESSGGGN